MHDTNCDKFLGRTYGWEEWGGDGEADLYLCPEQNSVIFRYGSNGHEYRSCWYGSFYADGTGGGPLREAFHVAQALGLLPNQKVDPVAELVTFDAVDGLDLVAATIKLRQYGLGDRVHLHVAPNGDIVMQTSRGDLTTTELIGPFDNPREPFNSETSVIYDMWLPELPPGR